MCEDINRTGASPNLPEKLKNSLGTNSFCINSSPHPFFGGEHRSVNPLDEVQERSRPVTDTVHILDQPGNFKVPGRHLPFSKKVSGLRHGDVDCRHAAGGFLPNLNLNPNPNAEPAD